MSGDDFAIAILEAIRRQPGVSSSRLAKDFDMPQVDILRLLNLLATDDAVLVGPAAIAVERRSDLSLSARVRLTPAGEALWAA